MSFFLGTAAVSASAFTISASGVAFDLAVFARSSVVSSNVGSFVQSAFADTARWKSIALVGSGFVAAVVTFPIALQFANEPFLQVEIGLLAAVVVGALTHAALLRYEFGRHRAAGRMSSTV